MNNNNHNNNNNNNNNFINISKLLRSEKRKIYTFTINTIIISMTGRTMASIKYDSNK
jgi:hypothetical protein